MNVYNEFHHPIQPDFNYMQPNAVRYLPHSIESGSRWQTYGSSSGWGTSIMDSALGEYAERKHFYLDVSSHKIGRLDSTLSQAEIAEFVNAFSQTSQGCSIESIEEHLFSLVGAFRIKDFSPCDIPVACILIGECKNKGDNLIVPLRDTCGCSTHKTMDKAIYGALVESMERQFLQRFWLTKTYSKLITEGLVAQALEKSPARHLYDQLRVAGELTVFDISDDEFPGRCILICYGNPERNSVGVNYCAGMSYSSSFSLSIEKALVELWQTFRFMNTFSANGRSASDLNDPCIRHFMGCNNYATYLAIANSRANDRYESNDAPLTTRSIIEVIKRKRLDGYLYMSGITHQSCSAYFCKYISPNIFMHMNNSSHINMRNKYSVAFFDKIIPSQLDVMVPFP